MSDPIIAVSADGMEHEFPAETDRAVIDRVMKNYAMSKAPKVDTAADSAARGLPPLPSHGLPQVPDAFPRDAAPPQQTVAPPTVMDRLRTNPVIGAPLQTLYRGGQGVEQLALHTAADASDLGGHFPNPVSNAIRTASDQADTAIAAQNRGYEESANRVDAASTDPRLSAALRKTGETEGNMLNPAGMAGNEIAATGTVANAAARGAVSGAGFAASQPVDDPTNFWAGKTKQVATGAVTGGVTGAAAQKLSGTKPSAPPSAQSFKDAATDSYKAAENQGVVVKQDSFKNAVADIRDQADEFGVDPSLQPRSTAVLNRLQNEAEQGDLTFKKAMTLRRVATSALSTPDKSDRAVAHIVIDGLDDYLKGLKPTDLTGQVTGDPALIKTFDLPQGDAKAAVDALTTARDQYARGAKLDTIGRLVEKAKDKVGANYTVAGFDTALRQQFGALKRNQAAWRQFNPDEQTAITKIIRGTPIQNVARQVGKLAPQGALNILGELGAFGGALYEGRPDFAAAVAGTAAVGAIAKGQANRMGEQNVNGLRMIVTGSSRPLPVPPGPTPDALVRNPLATFAAQSLLQPRSQ